MIDELTFYIYWYLNDLQPSLQILHSSLIPLDHFLWLQSRSFCITYLVCPKRKITLLLYKYSQTNWYKNKIFFTKFTVFVESEDDCSLVESCCCSFCCIDVEYFTKDVSRINLCTRTLACFDSHWTTPVRVFLSKNGI